MVYSKQSWSDGSTGQTPLNATRLAAIEQGIADAAATADNAVSVVSQTLSSAQKAQVKQNLGLSGLPISAFRTVADPVLTDAQALALVGEGGYFTVDTA